MNDAIRDQIMRGASTSDLGRLASESGMASLKEDVSRKVAEGLTSPHEAARVIQSDVGSVAPCPDCGGRCRGMPSAVHTVGEWRGDFVPVEPW